MRDHRHDVSDRFLILRTNRQDNQCKCRTTQSTTLCWWHHPVSPLSLAIAGFWSIFHHCSSHSTGFQVINIKHAWCLQLEIREIPIQIIAVRMLYNVIFTRNYKTYQPFILALILMALNSCTQAEWRHKYVKAACRYWGSHQQFLPQ